MRALVTRARELNLGTTAHLAQTGLARMNVRDAARLGLRVDGALLRALRRAARHLLASSRTRPTTTTTTSSTASRRWRASGTRSTRAAARRGTALLDELVSRQFILDPTMTIYAASRDVMRARNADWHQTLHAARRCWDFYQPSREAHGSYWFDWTTEDEVAWRNFYRVWMSFLNDYKNRGGRVTTGSDSGFIYKLYGFGYIEELELLQEAGFHPLEVIRAATLHGAQALHEPQGQGHRVRR